MIAVLLGVSSALGYGISDYFAGPASRRFSPVLLVLYSQVAQAVVILVVLAIRVREADPESLSWGLAAGVVNAVALVAYYEALGRGTIAVIAPIASTGAAIPIAVTLFQGDAPSVTVVGGLVVILVGIVVVAASGPADDVCSEAPCRGAMAPFRPPHADVRPDRLALSLALVAAGAFGSYFLLVDRGTAGEELASSLWVAEGVQLGALATTAGVVLVRRQPWGLPRGSIASSLTVITGLNLLADLTLIMAMGRGTAAVVGVLTSLAPVVTVALALGLRSERPSRQQAIGAGLAVLGTLVVSAAQ
jgi:drug/metabolite transporter (DMT)-like permease